MDSDASFPRGAARRRTSGRSGRSRRPGCRIASNPRRRPGPHPRRPVVLRRGRHRRDDPGMPRYHRYIRQRQGRPRGQGGDAKARPPLARRRRAPPRRPRVDRLRRLHGGRHHDGLRPAQRPQDRPDGAVSADQGLLRAGPAGASRAVRTQTRPRHCTSTASPTAPASRHIPIDGASMMNQSDDHRRQKDPRRRSAGHAVRLCTKAPRSPETRRRWSMAHAGVERPIPRGCISEPDAGAGFDRRIGMCDTRAP